MKQILFVVVMLLIMTSCSQGEMPVRQDEFLPVTEAVSHITQDKARSRLAKFLAANNVTTRSSSSSIGEAIALGKDQKPLTRSEEDEAWFYYFPIDNGAKYAIMAAKPEMPDVLAYGEGTPSWEDGTSYVPNPERWDITNLIPVDTLPIIGTDEDSIITVYGDMYFPEIKGSTVTDLCPVKWDQNDPFNKYCPSTKRWPNIKALAGCVPLAVAQMFAAENCRPVGYGDFIIDWDLLLSCPDVPSMKADTVALNHLARLLVILGKKENLDAEYSSNGEYLTTAYHTDVIRTLRNFGFHDPGVNRLFDRETLIKELNRGYPVIMSGSVEGEPVGHEFLVHGYLRGYREVRRYSAKNHHIISSETEIYYFFQINWGWGGRCDGFYIETGFRPGHGEYYNPANNPDYPDQHKYDYTYYREMIVGVKKTPEK